MLSSKLKDRPQEEKLPGGATDGYAGVSRHSPQVGEPAHGGGSPSGASGVGLPPRVYTGC
ncbi:MAG: hypothetical protein KME32_01015 [Mojavia pulchra JT2-VF2]|uniref:Uncharacterized protein n=1 Tax=Mojavia pulchra JT2-VF2 TaxID=287848 RepID=A0A951UFC8_9NOST|nr:hypothetical protein [Mojavia pulchra JT2-VF2]